MLYKLIISSFLFVFVNGFSLNNSTELVSTYAKVARWGSASSTHSPSEARSNGQSLWTHRSDVSIRRGQNIKPKQGVTYYYSMKAPTSKVDQVHLEPIPSKGEVQERFNPRPYFDFVFDGPPRTNKQSESIKSNNLPDNSKPPSIVYGRPIDTPPAALPPTNFDSKPSNSYESPFSSYNPPDAGSSDSKNNVPDAFNYPPNDNQSPPYSNSDDSQPPKDTYGPPNQPPAPPSPSYGVPADSTGPSNSNNFYNVPSLSNSKPKPMKDNSQQSNAFHPPLASSPPSDGSVPQKQPDDYPSFSPDNGDSPDNSYYAPHQNNGNGDHSYTDNFDMGDNANKDHHAPYGPPPMDNSYKDDNGYKDHAHHSSHSSNHGPPITQTVQPPESAEPPYFDHPPTNQDYHHSAPQPPSMAESDLAPPPAGIPYGKIPQYLDHEPNPHDFYHHYGHDIYHEVHHPTTTTTTEAPRAGHYSYYYLGRKLWYIPLYFSVYFIVYVTVLILKSIARHKIQFSHNFDKGRSSRHLDIDMVNQTAIHAVENVDRKYM